MSVHWERMTAMIHWVHVPIQMDHSRVHVRPVIKEMVVRVQVCMDLFALTISRKY